MSSTLCFIASTHPSPFWQCFRRKPSPLRADGSSTYVFRNHAINIGVFCTVYAVCSLSFFNRSAVCSGVSSAKMSTSDAVYGPRFSGLPHSSALASDGMSKGTFSDAVPSAVRVTPGRNSPSPTVSGRLPVVCCHSGVYTCVSCGVMGRRAVSLGFKRPVSGTTVVI